MTPNTPNASRSAASNPRPSQGPGWHSALALCFGVVAAGIFYYFLRGTGSRAPLALILNGNAEAGAAKLAAYAFIAGGIQSFVLRLNPRLGFMALLCTTLTLFGVLIAWNVLPRIADGLPYAGGALALLALAGLTYIGWRRGAQRAALGRSGTAVSLAVCALALLLAVWALVLRPLIF